MAPCRRRRRRRQLEVCAGILVFPAPERHWQHHETDFMTTRRLVLAIWLLLAAVSCVAGTGEHGGLRRASLQMPPQPGRNWTRQPVLALQPAMRNITCDVSLFALQKAMARLRQQRSR